MPRRKPSNPTRRNVTGDGIGGLPTPDAPAVTGTANHQLDASRVGVPPTVASRATSLSPDGHGSLDLGGGGAVLGSVNSGAADGGGGTTAGRGGLATMEEKEEEHKGSWEGGEDEEEEEEEEEEEQVQPTSSRRKRQKMDHVENSVSRPIGEIGGSVALPLDRSDSLHEIRGLRMVVLPAPGRARFVRNARTSRFAVQGDEEEEQQDAGAGDGDGEEGRGSENRTATLQLGVGIEFAGEGTADGGQAIPSDPDGQELRAAGTMMIRITPEIFSALEDLDRDGLIAVTAAARQGAPAPRDQAPAALPPPSPESSSAAAASVSLPASSPPISLEFHLLSKAFDRDVRLRPMSIAKLQLVIGWLFPRAVDGFYRPAGRHSGGDSESPPSASEILHALDAARGTDPDIRAAIQQGPREPLPPLDELVISLRHHQKAAIQWMLDIEKGARVDDTLSSRKVSSEVRCMKGGKLLDEDAEDERKESEGKDGADKPIAAVLPSQAFPGYESTENREKSALSAAAAVTTLERNALLLGWVRLALLPPPPANAVVNVKTRNKEDDGKNSGSEEKVVEEHNRGVSAEAGSVNNDIAALVDDEESGAVLAAIQRDSSDERGSRSNTASKTANKTTNRETKRKKTKKTNNKARDGLVSTTLQSTAAAVNTICIPPGPQNSSQSATEDRGGLTATPPTGGGVLRAGPDHVWFHVPSARLAKELPEEWVAFADVSGGILADEMGLGKTVEMLGCILANPCPSPVDEGLPLPFSSSGSGSSNSTSAAAIGISGASGSAVAASGSGEDEWDGENDSSAAAEASAGKSNYWDDLTPADEGSACVCGRGDDEPLAPGDLCFVQCDSCGWWLHGGCCGFVPAAEGEDEEEQEFTCVVCSCLTLLKAPKRCGSTLIICPHKIKSQWEREIVARTKSGALKVTVYNGVKEILSQGEKTKLASSKRRRSKRRPNVSDINVNSGDGEKDPNTSSGTPNGDANTNAVSGGDASNSHGGASQSSSSVGRDTDSVSGSGRPKRRKVGNTSQDESTQASRDSETSRNAGATVSGAGVGGPCDDTATESTTPGASSGSSGVGGGDGAAAGNGVEVGRGDDVEDSQDNPFALLSPQTLASYDVVLTTFEVLRAEVHHAESRFAGVSGEGGIGGAGPGAAGRPSLRRKKRYRVVPSPLPALKWWRVVVDEAHMVESTTQETAKMALKIPAIYRWCVTGTPIGKGSVDDLYGLLVFLKASPLDDKAVWAKAIREPIDRRLPGAMERLAAALKQVMWRVTKSSVAAQINIPPQNCVDRRLSFSSVEEHFYRKQHRAAAADAQRTAREGGSRTEEKMFNSLLALRQACCHPCIGSGGIEKTPAGGGSRLGGGGLAAGAKGGGQGRWLSMGQILDRLIDEERLKAEEAQRKVILNLNASGAVARLILQAQERRNDAAVGEGERDEGSRETPETLLRDSISCYRRALQMAQDNRTPGPLTGGAEVTGSRTFLLPSRVKRHPRKAPVAGYTSSGPHVALDPSTTAVAASTRITTTTPASAATAAVFMELRKPLELAWNVELVPAQATEEVVDCTGGVSERAPGGEQRRAGAATREVREVHGQVEESATEKGKGKSDTESSKPRDPAWARLVFSDRKRILRIRARCSRHELEYTAATAPASPPAGSVPPASNGSGAAATAAVAEVPASDDPAQGDTAARPLSPVAEDVPPTAEPSTDETSGTLAKLKAESDEIEGVVAAAAVSTASGGFSRGNPRGRRRDEPGTVVCYPRVCILQASSQAGMFEDVVRFSLDAPSSSPPAKLDGEGENIEDVSPVVVQGGKVDVAASAPKNASVARSGERKGEGDNEGSNRARENNDNKSGSTESEDQWKEVVVPPSSSLRAREWRIVVETCHLILGEEIQAEEEEEQEVSLVGSVGGTAAAMRRNKRRLPRQPWRNDGSVSKAVRVGMEVELMEAEVDADSLQMLHAAHNLLDVLDHTKERLRQLPASQVPSAGQVAHLLRDLRGQTPEQLRQLVDRVKVDYVANSVGVHRASRLQLQEAGRASAEALEAAAKNRIGGLEWWEAALRYMESRRDDGDFVQRAQLELLHEKAGQYGVMVRRSFPAFDSIGGLRIALAMKIKEAETKRKGVLRKLESLSTDPGPMEVHSNSNCRRCRADWGKTGPICGHCKVEEHIDAWEACVVYFRRPLKNTTAAAGNPGLGGGGSAGFAAGSSSGPGKQGEAGPGVNNAHQGHTFKEPSATPRLLRLIQRWIKEQARGGGAGGGGGGASGGRQNGQVEDWAALSAESKDFLASWEASERELLASRALWRAHLDLLSNIDELGSCVTPLRLADPAEEPRLGLLTDDQRRMVLTEGVLGIRRREYELERQASAHALESSRGQLSYLSTLVKERSDESSGAAKECAVCQDDLVEEVAVLPCGHTFHPECIGFLRKVGGSGGRFRCPTCRRSSSGADVRFASTLDQLDGSASGLPVKGSWGTKITALVGDILALGPTDKCLVFSQWDDMLDIVELAFKENEVSYARMKGKKRSELALEAFRADNGPRTLMLPIKTGSHGLNLVEANHVFLLEPLLNAAVEAQAVNRVHRGGQTRTTTIHRFVVRGTIEEDIERLRNKKLSMSRLANSPRSPRSKSRGKSKGKGKGKASSPGRPAATTANGAGAVRSLTDDMAAIAHTAQNGVVDVDDAMVGDGGGKGTDEKERNGDSASVETGESAGAVARTTMTETAEKAGERYPHGDGRVEAALGNASAGNSTQQSQKHRLRASEPDEEEEEEEEESEEGEQEAGEDEVSFVGSVTAMSERRALSLDDLKALFQ